MTPAARVAVVQHHFLLAESLSLALAAEGFAARPIPLEGMNASALLGSVLAVDPTVVVLGLDLAGAGDAMVLVQPLRRAGCAIVATTTDDPARQGEALALGAHSVLSESARLAQVLEAVRRAVGGSPTMSEPERLDLIRRWHRTRLSDEHHRARLDRLTPRERQVLSQLAAGRRVGTIARDFCVSEATVRTQVKSILAKLRVNSQIAAVAIARDAGWRAQREPGRPPGRPGGRSVRHRT
jgi:two-component system, NarL family, nitrate/nitrite response regulator NarL